MWELSRTSAWTAQPSTFHCLELVRGHCLMARGREPFFIRERSENPRVNECYQCLLFWVKLCHIFITAGRFILSWSFEVVTYLTHLQDGFILGSFSQIHLHIELFLHGAPCNTALPWNILWATLQWIIYTCPLSLLLWASVLLISLVMVVFVNL